VATCVEENRFDLEKTLATAVAAGAGAPIPKTEQELRRGSATTNPNIDKNTTRLSRAGLNLRQSAKGTQYFRQTRLPSQALRWTGRAAGAVAIPALIAEGFYDWGVIGYCAATCP
jgi:hypothetical protein